MWTTLLLALALAPTTADVAPHGLYVEARTAAVFAGACHYGSQYTTQGREALLAWRIEGGTHRGVDLTGVEIAAAVSADRNLDEAEAKTRAVIYVDTGLPLRQRNAAAAWVREQHPELLRPWTRRMLPIEISLADDAFAVTIGDDVELRGSGLPDRRCCTMPFDRWYEPFEALPQSIVGYAEDFRFEEPALGRRWHRRGENNVFFGRFGVPAQSGAAKGPAHDA